MGVTHMNHPFDLPNVKTGKDLLKFFIDAKEYVQTKSASVKIDGVNIPVKLIHGNFGKRFAADRGSLKPEDVLGITAKNVHKRFREGHGFIEMIPKALQVFDAALSSITKELQELGLYDDPTIYLNTEFVQAGGKTNVLQYKDPETGEPIDYNFIAVHNLGQFYEKETKIKGKMYRPGLDRPVNPIDGKKISDAATEIPYDESVMRSLIKKLDQVGRELGFRVYGDVPTQKLKKLGIKINLDNALDEEVLIYINKESPPEKKTLGEWLMLVENPKTTKQTLTLKNGKVTDALNKELYLLIVEGKRYLQDLLLDEQDYEKAVAGAIIYHATRKLGQPILDPLNSDLGTVNEHEGIVLRDEKLFGPKPVKITGEFIVAGMVSQFRKDQPAETPAPAEEPQNVIGEDGEEATSYVFIPGGFKPPHKGHLYLIKDAVKQAGDSKPYVVTGEDTRDGITLEQSKRILDLYLANEDIPTGFAMNELDVIRVPVGGAPVLGAAGEHLARKDGTPRYTDSPIQAIYNKCISLPQFSIVHIAASSADPKHGLIGQSIVDARPDLTVKTIVVTITKEFMDPKTGDKLSATVMRNVLRSGDFERFKDFIPESSVKNAGHIFSSILGGQFSAEEVEQEQKPFRSDDIHGIEDQELEEVSIAANVAGTAGPWKKKRKVNENNFRILKEQFIDEVANYLLKQ